MWRYLKCQQFLNVPNIFNPKCFDSVKNVFIMKMYMLKVVH